MFIYIGAGMSTYFNIPDMSGFMKLFDEQFEDQQIYTDIRSFMGERPNLEVLMTVLSNLAESPEWFWKRIAPHTSEFLVASGLLNQYLENDRTTDDATQLLDRVMHLIFSTCIGKVEKEEREGVTAVYDALFAAIKDAEIVNLRKTGDQKVIFPEGLCIATTNYDAAIERYWELHETELNDGLVQDQVKKKFRLEVSEENLHFGVVPALFKFHGSVDLFRRGTQIYRENISANDVEKLGIDGIIQKYGNLTLVYPIESVGQEHVTQSPYLDLFYVFRNKLRDEARPLNLWLILGTSLQDATLCSAMDYALSQKKSAELPVVILYDKHATKIKASIPDRFSALRDCLEPLEAEIELGQQGFDKLIEVLSVCKTDNRLTHVPKPKR